jgi:signal transduction histidine kinase
VTRVSGLARDITEQQITQSIVRDRTAQLDVIFNLSPDAFVSFDHHLKVKYANPAFGRMTGWRDEAIKGMSEAQFSRQLSQLCVAERPFRSISVMRAAVLAGHSPTSELIELNGVPQRILRISLQLSDAPTVSQILYLRDVTHETIVEAMKTEFLATAAHELRTPMASIVGFAEILCTHPLQQAEQLEFAEIIWRQSLHLAGILDELLDLSRIEAHGGKGLLLASLDLTAKVNEVVKAFPLPEGRDAPAVNLPPLTCKADRDKVRQVLNNVISNAYKFSGPGTGITITPAKPAVHPRSGRRLIGLVVQDAGIGMTPEQLARVFERFYRADTTGAIPGNGLGLSISREIMELMGGQVIIASTPQQGTTVSLMFEQFYEPPQLLPPAAPSPLLTTTAMA